MRNDNDGRQRICTAAGREDAVSRAQSFTVEAGEWVAGHRRQRRRKNTLLRLLTRWRGWRRVYWRGEPCAACARQLPSQPAVDRGTSRRLKPPDGTGRPLLPPRRRRARLPGALANRATAGLSPVPVARLSRPKLAAPVALVARRNG